MTESERVRLMVDDKKELAALRAEVGRLREAAEPFATMVRLVGLEYGDEEWVVWIRGKDEKGEMREAGLQWLDLRRLAELMEGLLEKEAADA